LPKLVNKIRERKLSIIKKRLVRQPLQNMPQRVS
jgi:hypothetical protein